MCECIIFISFVIIILCVTEKWLKSCWLTSLPSNMYFYDSEDRDISVYFIFTRACKPGSLDTFFCWFLNKQLNWKLLLFSSHKSFKPYKNWVHCDINLAPNKGLVRNWKSESWEPKSCQNLQNIKNQAKKF